MESRARLLGHPIHQMLIPIPLGLFIMATVCDLVIMAGHPPAWLGNVSFCNLVAGVAVALVAAVFGLIDLLGIPRNTRAFRIGVLHGVGNLVVVMLFAISVGLRWGLVDHAPSVGAFVLEVIAFLMAAVTGWLGGELVDRLGVGVSDYASLNAPSTLARARTVEATKTHA